MCLESVVCVCVCVCVCVSVCMSMMCMCGDMYCDMCVEVREQLCGGGSLYWGQIQVTQLWCLSLLTVIKQNKTKQNKTKQNKTKHQNFQMLSGHDHLTLRT